LNFKKYESFSAQDGSPATDDGIRKKREKMEKTKRAILKYYRRIAGVGFSSESVQYTEPDGLFVQLTKGIGKR
jgi:hypothetical protein